MRHVSDGALRRMIDEPATMTGRDRSHYAGCSRCQERRQQIESNYIVAARELGAIPPPSQIGAARSRLGAALANGADARPARRIWSPFGANRSWAWAAGVAALLVVAVGFTPASSFAGNVLTIFQPRQFVVVPVTQGELRTLPNLARYGTLRVHRGLQSRQYSSLSAAESASGMHLVSPSFVPSLVPRGRTFQMIPPQTSSFTFSAKKAYRVATQLHQRLRPMPDDLNGATVQLATGSAVLTMYGGQQTIPSLVIGQTTLPRITSTGASLQTIEDYILHMPGVSKNLVRQIESIGKPTTTLPIPIPVSWALAQHVTVQGSPGLLVGDDTGVASIVVWQHGGTIYGVAGALTRSQILQVANSLH